MTTQTSGTEVPIASVEETVEPPRGHGRGRGSFLEVLTDPRSIQWLLGSGGVLLVAGLVIWLASMGVFDNPWIVAGSIGAATLATMAGGWSLLKRTRHTLAGRAVTLLACLVMPLNLWFYHANGLMTIDGHLWMAALVCCTLYAVSVLLLADALFVYVLVAGVAATGMLILADVHRLAEIASPSVLLMAMALICLHVERAFTPDETLPFSRDRFGKACFLSALALVCSSLGLLAGAQVLGHLGLTQLTGQIPEIITQKSLQWIGIGVTLAGAYALAYSGLVVQRKTGYLPASVATLLWALAQVTYTLELARTPWMLIAVLAAPAVVIHLFALLLRKPELAKTHSQMTALAVAASWLPVLYGASLVWIQRGQADSLPIAGAMLAAAVVARLGALLVKSHADQERTGIVGSAVALLIAASAALHAHGHTSALQQAPALMLLPLGYMVTAVLRRDHRTCGTFCTIATVQAIAVFGAAIVNLERGATAWPMAQVFALAAATAVAGMIASGKRAYLYAACWAGTISLLSLLLHLDASNLTACIAFASTALGLLALGRVVGMIHGARTGTPLTISGQILLSILGTAQVLYAITRIGHGSITNAYALALVAAATGLAGWLSKDGWRRWLYTADISYTMVAIALGAYYCHLTGWQMLEVVCVAIGLSLLASGHRAWHREATGQSAVDEWTGLSLNLGAVFAGLPLLIAVIAHRATGPLSLVDEIALLTLSAAMFVSGVLLRIRSTTLVGGFLAALHVIILVVSAGMRAQLAIGVYMALGGGAVFAAGVLLSIYRERLLALPDRIRERQGLFQVLNWR